MTEAPERIWAMGRRERHSKITDWEYGVWDLIQDGDGDAEYIRADLHQAALDRAEADKAAAGRDAVEFIYKHGDLTYSAANAAIRLLTQNGFQIVRECGKP